MTGPSTREFDDLYSLKILVGRLRERHLASLVPFEDQKSQSFKQSEQRPDKDELSMSSTATCIGSLVQAGVWGATVDGSSRLGWWKGREERYYSKLLSEPWVSAGLKPDNPFTVGFVVEACADLRKIDHNLENGPKPLAEKLERAITLLTRAMNERKKGDERPIGAISVLEYPPSAYLTQLVARALNRFNRLEPDMAKAVTTWALKEVSAQLALIAAKSRAADPLQLAYAIICAMSYRETSKRTPTELEILRSAIRVFFESQLPNGGWPPSRPLFHYPASGSAYCFDYETLAQLLLCAELQGSLLQYLPQIGKATSALDETKFDLGNGAYGWASNQTTQLPGPESWATASVYLFLYALDRLLAEAIRRAIATELEVPYTGVRASKSDFADFAPKFLDCPWSATSDVNKTLKPKIFELLVQPLAKSAQAVSQGQKLPPDAHVSAILFGPPGTSKTEIVDQIADFIGWPAVVVDPSYFVKAGLDQIQAQANRIFRMLAAAEELIVLFDEFDEMVRNRAESEELLSRFLTTAMLPKLARINKERRILFVVATNYIDSFDVAISRPGRFDLVLQMMPPLAAAKLARWPDELGKLQRLVVDGDFQLHLAELTYLETKALADGIRTLGEQDNAQAKALWDNTLTDCILSKRNDRSPRGLRNQRIAAARMPPQDDGGRQQAAQEPEAGGSTEPVADQEAETTETWRDTSRREVKFIRPRL